MIRYRGILIGTGLLLGLCVPQRAVAQQGPGPCDSPECCRQAEGAELHGRVQTAEVGAPIPGATVTIRITAPPEEGATSTQELQSAEDGAYRLCGLPTPAQLEARAERSGAISRSVSFRLDAPQRVELSFEIRGLPENLDSLEVAAGAAADEAKPGRIVGRIEDAETGRPVAEAQLTLRPSGLGVLTDEEGRFTIPKAPSGKGTLAIHHVAYGDQTVEVEIPSDLTVDLDITLPPKAIEMEPIDVKVNATIRDPYLERRGYYERKEWADKVGIGDFLEAPSIQGRGARVSHALATMPGIRSLGGFVHLTRHSTSFHGGPCFPAIYLDGVKLAGSAATKGARRNPRGQQWGHYRDRLGGSRGLNSMISPIDLAAIEVYKGPASTAGEFQASDSRCGVIVLWTKHGPGPTSSNGGP